MAPPSTSTPEKADPRAPVRRWGLVGELWKIVRTDRLTWFVAVVTAFVLTASRYHTGTAEYRRLVSGAVIERGGVVALVAERLFGEGARVWWAATTGPVEAYLYWFWSSALLFVALPLVLARLVPGVRGTDFGFGLGDRRAGLGGAALLFLVMLPFVALASDAPAFQHQYPMARGATSSWRALVVFELSYAAYLVSWEFVNRGFVCIGLYPRLGAAPILLHTIPFAVMHAGKPELEAYGSIAAGIALGALAVRTRSFWWGALLHAGVALSMDLFALARSGRWPVAW